MQCRAAAYSSTREELNESSPRCGRRAIALALQRGQKRGREAVRRRGEEATPDAEEPGRGNFKRGNSRPAKAGPPPKPANADLRCPSWKAKGRDAEPFERTTAQESVYSPTQINSRRYIEPAA